MKFSKYLILVLACSVAMLSACGSDQTDVVSAEDVETSNNDIYNLSKFPIGVQNGDISIEYYATLEEARAEYDNLLSNIKSVQSNVNKEEEMKDLYRGFLLYINGLNYTISNSNEEEIDKYFSSFLYNAEHNVKYRIKYVDSKSSIDDSVAKTYFNDAKNDLLMVLEVMNKYELFYN